jgi:hypothetical protein
MGALTWAEQSFRLWHRGQAVLCGGAFSRSLLSCLGLVEVSPHVWSITILAQGELSVSPTCGGGMLCGLLQHFVSSVGHRMDVGSRAAALLWKLMKPGRIIYCAV